MKRVFWIVLLMSSTAFGQTNSEIAYDKAEEAIRLMDQGEIKKSIVILEECMKLDPTNYTYPYEIAFAHTLAKDYEKAIKILNKTKKYKVINSQVYQMLGNSYSYLGKPKQAIKEYEEGIERFPYAGNLHLEKGNIYLQQENYNEAVVNYRRGIMADPMFSSNYFRLAKLYMSSNDKLAGIIYGEIFMNIERTSKRTEEMSELLLKSYQSSITLGETESKITFCKVVIDASTLLDGEAFKLPLCAAFERNFIMTILGHTEVNLASLSKMRTSFIESFYQEDYKNYPNVMFAYQKELLDKGLFEAYNFYLFQIGAEEEFATWRKANEDKYQEFYKWYVQKENVLKVNTANVYLN